MNTYNTTPRSLRWPVLPALAFLVFGVLAQACATSSSSSTPAAPSGPAELDGTKWKLVALGGALDGRVIQFQKRGSSAYEGKLVSLGRRLQDVVGLQEGFVMFQLKRKGENEFEGVYKAVDPKGGQQDKEVVVFVNGNTMTWNQESAVWEKQD
jgi:hypothetical protein